MSGYERQTSVLENYRPAEDDRLNETHVIKEFYGKTDRNGHVTVYTDGSVFGAKENDDYRGFGGYAFAFDSKVHAESNYSSEVVRYGNLENATSSEAELFAVLQALKHNTRSAHIEIVSDCSDVVLGIANIHEKVHEYNKFIKEGVGDKNRYEKRKFRSLKTWKSIWEEIFMNDNIASLSARWVRSHVLSNEEAKKISPDDFSDPKERRYVKDMLGNHRADQLATLGVLKAVKRMLVLLHSDEMPEENRAHLTQIAKKNFSSSSMCCSEAIKLVAVDKIDHFKDEVLETFLPYSTMESIREVRQNLEAGMSVSEAMYSHVSHPKVVGSSDLKKEVVTPFLKKAAEMTRNDEGDFGSDISNH